MPEPARCASEPGAEHFFAKAAVPAEVAAEWWQAAMAGLASDQDLDPRLALLAGLGFRRGPLPGLRVSPADRALLIAALGRGDPLRPALVVMTVAAMAEPGRAAADLEPLAARAILALLPKPGKRSGNDGHTGALAILAMLPRIRADGAERQDLATAGDACKSWAKRAIRPLLAHSGIVSVRSADIDTQEAVKNPEFVPSLLAQAPLWDGAGALLARTLEAVPAAQLEQLWDAILARGDRAKLAALARPRLIRRLAEGGLALEERLAALACLAVAGDGQAASAGLAALDQAELAAVELWAPAFDRVALIDPAHPLIAAARARWAADPASAVDLWLLDVRCGKKPGAFPRAAYLRLTSRNEGISTAAQIGQMASDLARWFADFADPVAALPVPDGAVNGAANLAKAVARIRSHVSAGP